MKSKPQLNALFAALAVLLLQFAASSASAATYYWDTDGATAGFGNNAGIWGTSAFWSTNSTGAASTVFTSSTTTNDLVNFAGTGTRALGSTAASVTVSGTVEAGRITFGVAQPSGVPVVLTGGTIKLGGTNAAPHISPLGTNATINSAITLNSDVEIRAPSSGAGLLVTTLTLNGTISGGFNVTFSGVATVNSFATVSLGAQSTYTGSTLLQSTGNNLGVTLGINDALPTTTVLTLDGGNGSGSAAGRYVRMDLNGFNQTLAGLTSVVRTSRRDQGIVNSSATPATLTVNNATDYTFTGQLGSGGQNATNNAPNLGLTKGGAGKLTLAPQNLDGANAVLNLIYTGPTTVNNGILEIAGAGRLGNGNYAANITIASGAALVFSSTNANNLIGTLSGGGALTNTGTGSVTISGTDTLADNVVAGGSTVGINGGFVGRLSAEVGGTVNLPGPVAGTVTNLAFAGSGSMSFDVANGGTLVSPVDNGITNNGGAGSVTINIVGSVPAFGTHTLITYSGSLQGSGFSAYQLGTTPGGGVYALSHTGSAVQLIVSPALYWTGAQSGEWSTNAITPLQNWTLQSSPADYTNNFAVIFNDTVGFGNTTVDVSVADVTPFSVSFQNSGYNYTLQGSKAVAGASGLSKSGSGTLTVLNNNNYSGPTTISAGTVQVGNGGASGTLGSGAITDNGDLQFNRSDSLSVASAISGAGTVEQNGAGVLTLAGANTYAGATTINAGTLRLGAANSLPAGNSVTVNGLLDLNTFSATITALNGSGTVDTLAGGTPTLTTGASTTFSGVLQNTAGALALTKTGSGTLKLSGPNTYSGGTTIAGGIISVAGSSALGTGPVVFNGGARLSVGSGLTVTNPITIGANNGVAGRGLIEPAALGVSTVSGPITINDTPTDGGHFANIVNGATLDLAGPITSSVPIYVRNGTVKFSGGGSYTSLKLNQDTVVVGANNGIAANALFSFLSNDAGILDLNGFNQSLDGVTKGTKSATITNSSASASSTLTLTGTSTFAGTIADNGAQKINLTVNGGAFTLTHANTFSGATTISAGTLVLGNNLAINLTSGLSIAAGATLDTVALTVPLASSIPLTASGTGTSVGTTAAAIIGVSGNTHDLGTRALILNYDGAHPALYLSGGTLNLSDNPFTINGAVLANGVYTIIAQSDAPAITGSVAASTVTGTALTGKTGTVSLSGNTVLLTVNNAGPSGPAMLTNSVSGNTLSLSWPAGQGWRLEYQTNALTVGLGTNWVEAAGSSVSSTNITIDTSLPTVFYRLVYP